MLTQADLDPFQQEAADFLYEHDSAIAFMPVGAGKTATAITATRDLHYDGVIDSTIVFAPLRVATITWPEELEKWADGHDLDWISIAGSPYDNRWEDLWWAEARIAYGERKDLEQRLAKEQKKPADKRDQIKIDRMQNHLEGMRAAERAAAAELTVSHPLMISTYENIEWLADHFPDGWPWEHIIYDEGSRLSSHQSKRFKLARDRSRKNCKIAWDLTASPAAEGLHKLWAQVQLVNGNKIWDKSFYRWRPLYFVPADYKGYKWVPQFGAEERIYKDLEDIAFTINQEPEKPELLYRRRTVRMTDDEREIYDRMARDFVIQLSEDNEDDEVVAVNRGVLTGKLRQLAQGFAYRENDAETGETLDAYRFHDHKLKDLEELVESLQGEPLIIAYDFQEDLRRLRERWPDLLFLGAGASARQGAEACALWNEGKLPLFAIHPASGGHGLNLQYGGSHLCWFGMTWSREFYEQLTGRIWRRGQKKTCYAHHIVMENTIDEEVWEAVEHKASFQEALARGIRRLGVAT